MNVHAASAKIEQLLNDILRHGGFDLTYTIKPQDNGLRVVFKGPDVPILLARQAELLLALEHMAVRAVGLTSDDLSQINFDAGYFTLERDTRIQGFAHNAIRQVLTTGAPFRFPPMIARERRLLYLTLAPSGLTATSAGDEPNRYLILHPPLKRRKR